MPPDHGIDPIAIDVRSLMQRTVASLYSHLVTRPTGNLMIDAPRWTREVTGPVAEMGGISDILLSHRDDVADAEDQQRVEDHIDDGRDDKYGPLKLAVTHRAQRPEADHRRHAGDQRRLADVEETGQRRLGGRPRRSRFLVESFIEGEEFAVDAYYDEEGQPDSGPVPIFDVA